MTEITRWRAPGVSPRHFHLPLPEPPRSRHVSEVSRAPKDRLARVLEDWLSSLTITRTHDGE